MLSTGKENSQVVTGEALWCEEGLLEEHQDHSSGVNPVEGPHIEVPLVEVINPQSMGTL
jgi:hypothetical protein